MLFDFIIIIILYIIVFMILCGYYSLCERKVMAAFQLRIGPGLFIAGVLTPITDGIKLLFKNALLIISIDFIYLFINLLIVMVCMFTAVFLFPIGYIMIYDLNFGIFVVMALHLILNVTGVYIIGCYMFCSCYVYMASMRTLFFSILSEISILTILIISFIIDSFSFYSLKELSISQLFIENIYILGILFTILLCIIMLLDGMKLPFDYIECESELVAGLVTEFSGLFFVIYSLVEINHTLLNAITIVCLLFGGYYICFKSLFVILIIFMIPRCICYRLKVTNTQALLLNYMYIIGVLLLLLNIVIKVIMINI
jgi:NADH:ubiquinone oxidoreductase subunit H